MKGPCKKWSKLEYALKGHVSKAAEVLPALLGTFIMAILVSLRKAVEFVAKKTWDLIVFVAGLIGLLLMRKVLG